MAKASMVERDKKRAYLAQKYAAKRAALKAKATDKNATIEERFLANIELSKLPRNSSPVRQRNRCGLTGRPRGYYRKFNLSRIALRELGSKGYIPGLIKSSW